MILIQAAYELFTFIQAISIAPIRVHYNSEAQGEN